MKVYFNNSCKICKAEIDLYKKEKIQEIDWIDITGNEIAEKETSKSNKELLRRLHVKEDEKILKNDLLNPEDWIKDAVQQKIENCYSRFQSEWTVKLMNDASFSDPIPSNKSDFITLVTGRSDYKNRAERDS